MNYNIIYKGGEALEILNEVAIHMFQNKDNKLLICKTIEDAIIVE